MLSRLSLISTLLLVGITTVAIGAPVVETIEVIRAIEIPQIRSGNHTLNRRFINGVPGLPQCTDGGFPNLVLSYCVTENTIQASCASNQAPFNTMWSNPTCIDNTSCMDFKTSTDGVVFAACIDNNSIKSFDNNRKAGVFCKNYQINGGTDGKATLSFEIYDVAQRTIQVKSISFTVGNLSGSKQNTNNYSSIIDYNGQKVQVCFETVSAEAMLYGMFSFLAGTFG